MKKKAKWFFKIKPLRNQEEWDEAKEKFHQLDFPDQIGNQKNRDEKHGKHTLQSYRVDFKVNGFDTIGHYNYCEKCGEVRNKYLVMYNSGTPPRGFQQGTCVIREFVKHGKVVND